MQGEARLHYARSYGHVDWRAVQAALQSKAVEAALRGLAEPDAGLIPSMAKRLGLLHTGTAQQPQRRTPWRTAPLLPIKPDIGAPSESQQLRADLQDLRRALRRTNANKYTDKRCR